MTSTEPAIATRIERISTILSEEGIELLLVTPSADLLYLAGYGGHTSERPTMLVVAPGSKPVMVLPALEAPRLWGRDDLAVEAYSDGADPFAALSSLRKNGSVPGTIAISDSAWAAILLSVQARFPQASFVPASPLLRRLRMTKGPGELELLHDAGRRADRAFERLAGCRFSGQTEGQISETLDEILRSEGLARADWGPIVASGPNSASPHHMTSDREIQIGDAVVLDFGGVLEGYQADMTRTAHVGSPGPDFQKVYDVVLRAQQAGFEASVPGGTASSVDSAARSVIEVAGYGKYFIHRTGHGLGLDVHEEPYLIAGNELPLEAGMTFSVEPGVYMPGRFGIRIEDTVAVYEDGPRRFNEAPRDLQLVG